MRTTTLLTYASILGTSWIAAAQPAEPTTSQPPAPSVDASAGSKGPGKHWTVGIAPRVGVTIPTSKLGAMAVVGVHVGAAVAARGKLVVGFDASWSRPGRDGSVMDPRVPSPATYSIDQSEILVGLSVGYRLAGAEKKLVPWIAGGPILHVLHTRETTSIAPGENTARAVEAGLQVGGGVDFLVGPGFVVGDLRVIYSPLDNVLTGDSNAGNVVVAGGYRLVF